VPVPTERCPENVTRLDVAPLFGEAIRRLREHESISSLFD